MPSVYDRIRKVMQEQWEEAVSGQTYSLAMFESEPPEQQPPDEPAPEIAELPEPPQTDVAGAETVRTEDVPVDAAEEVPVVPDEPRPEIPASDPPETSVDAPREPYPSGSYLTGMEPLSVPPAPETPEPQMSEPAETVVDAPTEPMPTDVPVESQPFVVSDAPEPDDEEEFDFPGDVELSGADPVPLPAESPPVELPELIGEYPEPDVPEQWSLSEWQPPEQREFEEPDLEFDRELAAIGYAPIENPNPQSETSTDIEGLIDDRFSVLNAKGVL